MILSPHLVLPNWSSQKYFVSSPPLIRWIPSSGLWYLNNHTNSSTIPSSVLRPLHIIFFFLNFIVDYLFSIKIKQSLKVISISLISKLYNFNFFWSFLLILFFFKVVHILLTIIIMHYIFLISFGITKIFKFQIYYSFLVQLGQLGFFRFTLVHLGLLRSSPVHFGLFSSLDPLRFILVQLGLFGSF